MRTRIPAKLIITGVVLLSAVALLALGTFAWFTISKKGEAGQIGITFKSDNAWPFEFIQQESDWETLNDVINESGWQKELTLSMVVASDGTEHEPGDSFYLRPISTSDLEHWYLAEYDELGSVTGLTKVPLESVGNVNRYDPDPDPYDKDIPANHVYYYDLWIRTKNQTTDYGLHLNNPIDEANDFETLFGTYVLPGVQWDSSINKATIPEAGYDAATCIRVGFLFYEPLDDISHEINPTTATESDAETVREFWIYEPNCDSRAPSFKKYNIGEDNSYLSQREVAYIKTEDGVKKVKEHEESPQSGWVDTILPEYEGEDEQPGFVSVSDRTIRQLTSSWDLSKIAEKKQTDPITSRDIEVIGKFIHNNPEQSDRAGYEGIDTPEMAVLRHGANDQPGLPQHVRVFIWLEGQDIDCWNSSMSGPMAINLEFRGQEPAEP